MGINSVVGSYLDPLADKVNFQVSSFKLSGIGNCPIGYSSLHSSDQPFSCSYRF